MNMNTGYFGIKIPVLFRFPDVCENAICGPNAECVANDHASACVCRSGYEGNPNDIRIGCRPKPVPCAANTDCPPSTYCYADICRRTYEYCY
jgi:hypothetical protein